MVAALAQVAEVDDINELASMQFKAKSAEVWILHALRIFELRKVALSVLCVLKSTTVMCVQTVAQQHDGHRDCAGRSQSI